MLSVSKKELQNTLEHFYKVTGLKIVMYDADRNVIATHSDSFEPYCSTVRTVEKLSMRCLECDKNGFDICERTRAPHIYTCHMNITEAVAPILTNGIIIGYLMFGQVICLEDAKAAERCAILTAERFGLNKSIFLCQLNGVQRATRDYLFSALHIMSLCASYLYTNEIIKNSTDVLAYQIKEYIHAHISDDLSSEVLCKHFYISRSKLYRVSIDEFSMGIMEYIRDQRLSLAKKKLTETSSPIMQIAAEIGIPDTNYFIRVFKQKTGLTPSKYRASLHNR